MKIYVASSWRNRHQQEVVLMLREAGHDVYDFRNPAADNHGFHWSEIDPEWKTWRPFAYLAGLKHPLAEDGFAADFGAMQWADAGVLVLPCGRSAHIEAGWFVGAGKPLWIMLEDDGQLEPELMYKMATGVCVGFRGLLEAVNGYRLAKEGERSPVCAVTGEAIERNANTGANDDA